jgi:hypothetical protein
MVFTQVVDSYQCFLLDLIVITPRESNDLLYQCSILSDNLTAFFKGACKYIREEPKKFFLEEPVLCNAFYTVVFNIIQKDLECKCFKLLVEYHFFSIFRSLSYYVSN